MSHSAWTQREASVNVFKLKKKKAASCRGAPALNELHK